MAGQDYQDEYGYEYNPYEPEPAPGRYAPTPTGRENKDAYYVDLPPPPPTPPPGPPPPPPPPGGGDGGSGGGGGYGSPSSFTVSDSWPTFTAPPVPTISPFVKRPDFDYQSFAEPAPFSYGEFAYDSFTPPSLEDAQNEPGYAFARDEGQRALLNSRLATRRTGGTLKDLIGWGNKFAEQNYGNVYNRTANTYGINRGNAFENFQTNRSHAFDTHNTNRGNAFQTHQANEMGRLGAYTTNFGADKDTYDRNTAAQWDTFDRNFRSKMAEFDPRFTAAQLTFADIYNRDRDKLNSLTNIATAGAGA